METLWLLVKINAIFQIGEKLAYVALTLFAGKVGFKYWRDYKNSTEEEELFK